MYPPNTSLAYENMSTSRKSIKTDRTVRRNSNSAIIAGYFSMSLPKLDSSSRQKVSGNTGEQRHQSFVQNEHLCVDYSSQEQHKTFFSNTWNTFPKYKKF